VSRSVAEGARHDARRAAQRAGVKVTELSGPEVAVAQAVIRDLWGQQQVPQHNLLRALAHAGNTLVGAFADERCVGVALGFLGWHGGIHLHSHMTAVVPGRQSVGVGFALKLWQRALCLDRGVREIRWTYDPLISRNAYFNLVKLGAEVIAFEPDFYGDMDDAVNAGDHSDRFEVSWRLDSEGVQLAASGARAPQRPEGQLVEIPLDYDALRRADPAAARDVRLRTRGIFTRWMSEGMTPRWAQGGGYLFRATDRDLAAPRP
jgi:predicted GNAT superfamily acetyltransferase